MSSGAAPEERKVAKLSIPISDPKEMMDRLADFLSKRRDESTNVGAAPPATLERKDWIGEQPIEWLGPDPASQLLSLVLAHSRGAHPLTGQPLGLPFPKAFLDRKRTHGYYDGDGTARRRLRVGFRPLGIVFARPSLYEIAIDQIPLPVLEEDGFSVGPRYNEPGHRYEYVLFFRPEDDGLAPLSQAPAVPPDPVPF